MFREIEEQSLKQKYVKIFFVVSAYWVISISTVFINKTLFAGKSVDLDAPMFVTWFQCVVSTLICLGMHFLSKLFPENIKFPKASPFDYIVFKKVLPLSIIFTCAIASNNLCLKYVGVAFYYVGRSLTTVFNVFLSLIILREKTSLRCVLCCSIIIFGFWLGVDQESLTDTFSFKGTVLGVLGSFTLSLYSIYTKKVLPYVNQEILLLSFYTNFYSSILFIPLIVVNGELSNILHYESLGELWFWMIMCVGGICGFSIGIISVLQIKVTSPLTHNISGTAKACAQTVIATEWYRESKSFLWWVSNLLVLIASAMYARVKQMEMIEVRKKDILIQKA